MAENQAAHDAIAHLMGKGISKAAAVGMVAVFMAESSLKPGSQGNQPTETPGALNGSGAYGIMSLNGPRQNKLAAFATKKGLNYTLVNTQLDFALNEAANDYPKTWAVINNHDSSVGDVVKVMVEDYERPADAPGEIARAMKFAEEFIGYNIDVTPEPPAVPKPAPTPAPAPVAPVPSPALPASTSVVLDKRTLDFVLKLLATLTSLEA